MSRYKVNKSTGNLVSLDSPMIGASAAVPGAGGIVPAPAAGDQNNFLKGDGTWDDPNNNYVGTMRQWSALSLEEKKKYKTADIHKGYAIRYYPNGGTGNIVQDEKGIGEVYTIQDNEYTNFTPPGPVVDTEYTIDPEDSGHRYKKLFGYNLNYWDTEANGSGIDYNPGDQYLTNASLELYAQWELTQQIVGITDEQYLLTLIPDNGVDTITVKVGSTVIPPVSGTTTYWISKGDSPDISVTPKAEYEWVNPFDPGPMYSANYCNIDTEPIATLKFSSDEPFTLSVNSPGWLGVSNPGYIQYTIDHGDHWSTWNGSQLSGDESQSIYLRGKNNSVITGTEDDTTKWTFTGKYITGNIETLLDYEMVANGNEPIMGNSCYEYLFKGCSTLITPPDLPAINLSPKCYKHMFADCTSLTEAPELPARVLSPYCYNNMFANCDALIATPELPATTLATECYTSMFWSCNALTTVSELPARTLTPLCYRRMFQACSSLTIPPALPATTLAEQCYEYMFGSCTSLTTAPSLPATTLARSCYNSMFSGCSSLTTAASLLPATTLAEECYQDMFRNCTSLTTAPSLSATTLASRCCYEMFYGCTSLTTAASLPATTLAEQCYAYMFYSCTSLTTAPSLPATTLAEQCYKDMFRSCTSLTTAPELPATSLANYCYNSMFRACRSLKISTIQDSTTYKYTYRIPKTGTGTNATDALNDMFTNTGGTFTGTPTINTTYYTDHQPA